jgi:hypothetical protein
MTYRKNLCGCLSLPSSSNIFSKADAYPIGVLGGLHSKSFKFSLVIVLPMEPRQVKSYDILADNIAVFFPNVNEDL